MLNVIMLNGATKLNILAFRIMKLGIIKYNITSK
jgi:hypothetical protein